MLVTEINFTGTVKYPALLIMTPNNAENTDESMESRGNHQGSSSNQAAKLLPHGSVISLCHQGAVNRSSYTSHGP